MKPVVTLVILAANILAAPLAAAAQQTGKVPRVGFLSGSTLSGASHYVDAFRSGLRELGYVEGRNITIEYRWAEGQYDRLPGLAADLVRLKVDVIIAPTTAPALAAKNATGTIPIVFLILADPVAQGFVASLARPGGNSTGLTSTAGPEIYGKLLELLREAVPGVTRVAVLRNPTSPFGALFLNELEVAARSLGVKLQVLEARSPDALDDAFAAMLRERARALIVVPDPIFLLHRARLADQAAKSRLPAMYGIREHVEAGGLMAYAANFTDLYRRAATYVDRIIKGAKPADLPVEQPMRFELVINMRTAKALGLTIPPSIRIRADQVIQ